MLFIISFLNRLYCWLFVKLKTILLMCVLFVALMIIAVSLYFGNKQNESMINQKQDTKSIASVTASNQPPVSRVDLNKHNQMNDCWVAYQQKVYDITAWLPRHPGSAEAILPYCGTAEEFEQAFTEKHGTSKAKLLMKVGVFIGEFETKGALSQ